MSKKEIINWLEKQVKLFNLVTKNSFLSDGIQACRCYLSCGVQIFKGIEMLAEAARVDLTSQQINSQTIQYEFRFKGVNFFQLGRSDEK